MADNTIIQTGSFVSTGAPVTLNLRTATSWINVYNQTQIAANAVSTGYQFYYQFGMAPGTGIETQSNAGGTAVNQLWLTDGGFTPIDTSGNPLGALNNGSTQITAISNANPPVVTCGSTAGMSAGNVVRLYNVAGAQQLGGIDFTIGNGTFSGTTFSLDYMPAIVAGTTGSFRQIFFDPLYYPTHRYITKITQASQAVVSLSVTHGFTVGQEVRFVVPAAYGMTQINGLSGIITAVNTAVTAGTGNTITVNINTSAFTAFSFPLTAASPFTPAMVVPIGEDTATALSDNTNILADATVNTGIIGIQLAAGIDSPAGQTDDVIYWQAGQSFQA